MNSQSTEYPGSACLPPTRLIFFLGCSQTKKTPADPLASMQADPLVFFRQRTPQGKKIRRVGGKQAEPGVSSGL